MKRHQRYCMMLMLLCSLVSATKAQVYNFSYDSAGNRVQRKFVLNSRQSDEGGEEPAAFFVDRVADYEVKIAPDADGRKVKVELSGLKGEANGNVILYDMNGRKRSSVVIRRGAALLDMSRCVRGVYVMRIIVDDESTSWKITKE